MGFVRVNNVIFAAFPLGECGEGEACERQHGEDFPAGA